MDQLSISEVSYLLSVIPGFVFVWTYRHFTDTKKEIGEFEYAAQSFLWGIVLLLILILSSYFSGKTIPLPIKGNLDSLIGSYLGVAIAQTLILALPLGYVAAFLQRQGSFRAIDRFLMKIVSIKIEL